MTEGETGQQDSMFASVVNLASSVLQTLYWYKEKHLAYVSLVPS